LRLNGYQLINKHKEEVLFAKKVENGNLTLKEIATWLKKNSTKL